MENIMVSVDIGTTKICVIVGKMNEDGKIETLGMGISKSEGIHDGMVVNRILTVKSIKEAVEKAEKSSKINIKLVNIGIAGSHIGSYHDTGKITRDTNQEGDIFTQNDVNRLTKEIEKKVLDPGIEILHVVPQRYYIDDKEINNSMLVGCVGMQLKGEFNVITVSTSQINLLISCIKDAGLEVNDCILEPLASGFAVLSEEERDEGVAIVDIGGGTTDLVIYKDGVIRHTYSLGIGGVIITNDIKESCDISMKKAEGLKLKYGHALAESVNFNDRIVVSLPNQPIKTISSRELSRIIEYKLKQIIEAIHVQIILSKYENKLTRGIVITGGGSLLKDITPVFEVMTGQNVRLGTPNIHLIGNGSYKQLSSPIFSTSIGLLRSAFISIIDFDSMVDDNLMDDIHHKKTMKNYTSSLSFFRIISKKFRYLTKFLLAEDYNK